METYQDLEKKPTYRLMSVEEVQELIKYFERWLDGKTRVPLNEKGNYEIKIEMPVKQKEDEESNKGHE